MAALLVIGALASLCFAVSASARIVELGEFDTDTIVPSCPTEPCRALSRVTGFQKRVAGETDAYTVPADGRIVAWTVSLSTPGKKQFDFFADKFGGNPSAGITAFRPSKKKGERGLYTSIGESGVQDLTNYLGQVVQFPMANTVRVHKGDRIGLTVPTWAPALAINQPRSSVWRASRDPESCTDYFAQRAIQELGTQMTWGCAYRTEQLTYSVTLVTAPKPNKTKDDDKDKGKGNK